MSLVPSINFIYNHSVLHVRMQKLYELGARRVIVTGTGPLGCIPAELALSGSRNGECAPEPQRAAEIYNSLLPSMIQDLNNELRPDVFIASNAFDVNKDFISNPKQFGLFNLHVDPKTTSFLLIYIISVAVNGMMLFDGRPRFRVIEGGMLWTGTLQWAGNMQYFLEPLPKQEYVSILGCFSSRRTCNQVDCPKYDDGLHQVHESNEPQHHHGHGLQELKY